MESLEKKLVLLLQLAYEPMRGSLVSLKVIPRVLCRHVLQRITGNQMCTDSLVFLHVGITCMRKIVCLRLYFQPGNKASH